MRSLVRFIIASLLAALPQAVSAKDAEGWVVAWTGSVQGPKSVIRRLSPNRNLLSPIR